MAMAWIWTGMVVLSLVFGILSGNLDEVANAAMAGAQSAIDLSVSMAGMLCLWSGIMEIMNVCGLSLGLARAFRPLLRRLLPDASRDEEAMRPRPWASGPPAGWPGAAKALPATSCACWWC